MNFGCMTGVEYKGNIYFTLREGKGLFRLDIKNDTIELVAMLDVNYELMPIYQFAGIYNSIAWFIPGGADRIAKINLDSLEIDYIEIPYIKKYTPEDDVCYFTSFITGSVYKERFLCCNPRSVDVLLIIDMKTGDIVHLNHVNEPLKKGIVSGGFVYKDNFYLCKQSGVNVNAYNINGEEIKGCQFGSGDMNFHLAVNFDEKIYSIEYTESGPKLSIIDCKDEKCIDTRMLTNDFCGVTELKNVIMFLPLTGKILLVNKVTSEQEYAGGTWDLYNYETEMPNRMSTIMSDSRCFITTGDSGYIFELNDDGNIIKNWDLTGSLKKYMLAEIMRSQNYNDGVRGTDVLFEKESDIVLKDFVDAVSVL